MSYNSCRKLLKLRIIALMKYQKGIKRLASEVFRYIYAISAVERDRTTKTIIVYITI